ncbi:MAG TPA: VWA domain-containing protein, partial [Armatimonadetes bacterium]|nr:VWA domain-containing protein [Armatimonadota bacterium]
ASNDNARLTERITLTGSSKDPTPIDSVLVLDRSGSMDESAGDRRKIEAMRDAANLYADLLRDNPEDETSGDKLGFVKYNDGNADYMTLDFMDAAKDTEIATKLSDAALGAFSDLKPEGGTGIGGAMERAADVLLPSSDERKQVMVVITDGRETEDPRINDVVTPIQDANTDLIMFSVGVGQDIEPDKLQNITNVSNGFHQVAGSLTDTNVFDLETFYFKIFASAADMDLVVDPTHSETLLSPDPVIVDSAKIISSDRSATFLVLDDPVLRQFYDLEFLSPSGEIIVPGVTIGGIGIQESKRHTYKILRIVFPDISKADEYTGTWNLRLKPNGSWNVQAVQKPLIEGDIHYSNWISPLEGSVPIGFAGAVSSDYRLRVNVLPSSFIPGANIKLSATLTDREWPAPNGSVTVAVQSPSGVQSNVTLFDDG